MYFEIVCVPVLPSLSAGVCPTRELVSPDPIYVRGTSPFFGKVSGCVALHCEPSDSRSQNNTAATAAVGRKYSSEAGAFGAIYVESPRSIGGQAGRKRPNTFLRDRHFAIAPHDVGLRAKRTEVPAER